MRRSPGAQPGLRQGSGIFADVAPEIIVEEVTEKTQDTGLADAFVVQHSDKLAFHVLACPHSAIGNSFAQRLVRPNVTEGMVEPDQAPNPAT